MAQVVKYVNGTGKMGRGTDFRKDILNRWWAHTSENKGAYVRTQVMVQEKVYIIWYSRIFHRKSRESYMTEWQRARDRDTKHLEENGCCR